MEFLSRLVGGVGASQSKQAASNNPQQRLTRFKRSYTHAVQSWHKLRATKPGVPLDASTIGAIQNDFHRLSTLLDDDSRAPAPHLCLGFAASSYVYTAVARIALWVNSEALLGEAVALFAALVDGDEDGLLGDAHFAAALTGFVDKALGSSEVVVGAETLAEMLELIFGIAAKIRLQPELVHVWFRRKEVKEEDGENGEGEGEILHENTAAEMEERREDFPLCHQFIGHVYNEGRAGDFARTGLLYIFEAASHSHELEEWIVSSDMPTLMASGLGALYSQLGRKLSIAHPDTQLPFILALSDGGKSSIPADVESFYSSSFQAQLSTFMSYLVFWQDVLEHCQSDDIKQTLIDHFQIFFLQQILYPSLLESSDIDGGSSVAVLTYIWRILDSVDHPDIIHLILHYLLALPDPIVSKSATPRSPIAEKRRDEILTSKEYGLDEDRLSPSFFNLVDLILTSVQSSNPETVNAALRLVSTILSKHHGYAVSSLVKTIPAAAVKSERTMGVLHAENNILITLATDVAGQDNIDDAYENSLRDALGLIEAHVCSKTRLDFDKAQARKNKRRKSTILDHTHGNTEMQVHSLNENDPLLRSLLVLLRTFFTNDIETNLGLTNTIAHLISCPYSRLEGWLVAEPSKRNEADAASELTDALHRREEDDEPLVDEDELEQSRINAFHRNLLQTRHTPRTDSALITALRNLKSELDAVRSNIREFDHLVASRKRAFQGATEIEDELRDGAPPPGRSPRSSSNASRDRSSSSRAPSRGGSVRSSTTPIKSSARDIQASRPSSAQRGRSIAAVVIGDSTTGGSKKRPSPAPSGSRIASPALRAISDQQSSRRSSRSPTKAADRALSPLSATLFPPQNDGATHSSPRNEEEGTDDDDNASEVKEQTLAASLGAAVFERQIQFPTVGADASQAESEKLPQGEDAGAQEGKHVRQASLTHVLTNVVILQEFILELAAIIQVRASLLEGEIKFF